MNDFQALLVFTTAVIAISAVMVVILQNNFLSTIEKTKNTNRKKLEMKKSPQAMQRDGIRLISEELSRRENRRYKKDMGKHNERSFVVYDAVTGESFNYYEKKR